IPDVVIPAIDRKEQGEAVTIACPALLMLFYLAVLRLRKVERSGPSSAIFAICGMWVLALSFTMLAQTVRGNGFSGGEWTWGDFGYLLVSSFLPTRIVEFVMLEGSIVALLIGTVAMLICHIAFERSRWVVLPNLFSAVKLGGSTRNQ
ncbi:MAG: hypothetical protein WBY66_00700, partial [Candidatus Acidiferrales bacterium]